MKDVTVITLSAKPMPDREVPNNCKYLNHVSTFDTIAGLNTELLKAIGQVDTLFFTVQDDDDPVPQYIPTPSKGIGILYGDVIWMDGENKYRRKGGPWSAVRHQRHPHFILKSVCNTQSTLNISQKVLDLTIEFEFIYHYLLASLYGAQYDQNFESVWVKKKTGLHLKVKKMTDDTIAYANECRDKLLTSDFLRSSTS